MMKRVNELCKYLRIICAVSFCAVVAVLFATCILGGDIDEWRKMAADANGTNKNIQTVTVTFNAHGGTPAPAAQTVAKDGKATEPEGITKAGHTFGGWYTDDITFQYRWDFKNAPVTADITLYAKWVENPPNSYTVTFVSDGGGHVEDQVVASGGKATEPSVTKTGHRLAGWYKEAAFTNQWNFATDTVTGNIILHAKWIENLMIWIQGGTFMMGSLDSEAGSYDNERPQHLVMLSSFWIGKYEVTQEQYQAVMGTNPSNFTTDAAPGEIQSRRPVEQVSWYDALVFCNKLSMMEGLAPAYRISNSTDPAAWGTVPTSSNATWNAVTIASNADGYRLPTEAQWEYACRAGTQTPWHTANGTDSDLGNYAWYSPNNNSRTHEVGLKSPNAWGLYDMHGNVEEWCWDLFGSTNYYSETSAAGPDPLGPVWPDPLGISRRAIRGGNFSYAGQLIRSARRYDMIPSSTFSLIGFRLARPSN